MKSVLLKSPGGFDNIYVKESDTPGQPSPGQIKVAIKESSLNFHDLLVANGTVPTADNRLLMSDGAGVVEEVGEGVTEFQIGDNVVSCFFPQWPAGPAFEAVGSFPILQEMVSTGWQVKL
ncbi:alcohol dehydrogenase catalytic domain-containing protein [Vibrio sp. YIC-376]|uniref:alcohol dehydrogenase catalytic domain-containing protein n=1 Tax=Vibrio sp. YIC-376 TaxID=3136162 RepID=UPI00402A9272